MNDQAQKTPLVDHLRSVPRGHRTYWQCQFDEDGRPTGHTMFPVGRFSHEAADRIESDAERIAELEREHENAFEEAVALSEKINQLEQQVQADADGWIPWDSDESPVNGLTPVEVKYANGEVPYKDEANYIEWRFVRAYRPILDADDEPEATKWNGEGLPPVGCEVEVADDERLVYGRGESGEVIAHVENTAVVRMSYGLGCFESWALSPIRTAEDRAVEEIVEVIVSHYEHPKGAEQYMGLARALYRAGYRQE